MGTIGTLIADAASIAGKYQKRLTTDIPDSLFGRLVVVDGKAIQSNHPAFILGHLSLYPAKAMKLLGLPLGTTLPSDRLESIFSKETSCVDDITGDIYPSKQEIVLFLESSYEVALNGFEMHLTIDCSARTLPRVRSRRTAQRLARCWRFIWTATS